MHPTGHTLVKIRGNRMWFEKIPGDIEIDMGPPITVEYRNIDGYPCRISVKPDGARNIKGDVMATPMELGEFDSIKVIDPTFGTTVHEIPER